MSSQPWPQVQDNKGQDPMLGPYQPISGNGTRPQPHAVDQDLFSIDHRLYTADSEICKSRTILSASRNAIAALTRSCTTYEQLLSQWSKVHEALKMEHKKVRTELGSMTLKHRSVSQQLHERTLQAALDHGPEHNMKYQSGLREANDQFTAKNRSRSLKI
jgi:hypothetical protein